MPEDVLTTSDLGVKERKTSDRKRISFRISYREKELLQYYCTVYSRSPTEVLRGLVRSLSPGDPLITPLKTETSFDQNEPNVLIKMTFRVSEREKAILAYYCTVYSRSCSEVLRELVRSLSPDSPPPAPLKSEIAVGQKQSAGRKVI